MKVLSRFRLAMALSLLPIVFCSVVSAQQPSDSWGEEWTKEKKAALLNAAVGAGILTWGMFTWDYGQRTLYFRDEGWFGRTTNEGGADKLGHGFSGYALSHLFCYQYEKWGYEKEKAIRLGVLSSIGATGIMELGDSFSDFGFSYQDMLFDVLGAAIGYAMVKYPDIAEKIDFRAEYDPFRPGRRKKDVFTDYDRLKFLIAFKLSGIRTLNNSYMRYFEVHVGYYARGYDEYVENTVINDDRHRKIYVGVGLNIGELIKPLWNTKIFNYIQVPYTYAPADMPLDNN